MRTFLQQIIHKYDWFSEMECLNVLDDGFNENNIASALLDLARYDDERLRAKAFEVQHRLFSAHGLLFTWCMEAQLLTNDESLQFAHLVTTKLPIVRRLAKGSIEDGAGTR